jgi:4'-phosphopantetheinyl transferase
MQTSNWLSVDDIPAMGKNDVFVWKFNPNHLLTYSDGLQNFLSDTEKIRMDRLVDINSRQEFIICRGVLRFLLSQFTHLKPAEVQLSDDKHGKPELLLEMHAHPVFFNISHTEKLCLMAFSCENEVGVDVELVQPIKELDSMAKIYFSQKEFAIWRTKDEAEKTALFHEYWCAKEAILKAAGCGLTIHPGQVNTLDAFSGLPVKGKQEDGCFFEFKDCRLKQLPLGRKYKGCLAVFGGPPRVQLLEFTTQLLDADI